MQKKKALGMDPLSWLKGKTEEEMPEDNISNQEKQIDNPSETKNDDDNELNVEHKIQEEDRVYEPSDVTEKQRKAVLGENAYTSHVKPHEITQKESPATAFVIVYTILLLILGFIVYRDITKKIDRLDAKLESIEKQVDSGLISYEEVRSDELW